MIDQLAKLSELAPDICRANLAPTPVQYFIGEYGFWGNSAGELIACPMGLLDKNIGGRGALAWLRDAIEGEIERRGWNYQTSRIGWGEDRLQIVRIYIMDSRGIVHQYEAKSPVLEDTLLAAFLAAVEGEGR